MLQPTAPHWGAPRARPSAAPGPKRLPTQASPAPFAFVVRCETPWGSYTCRSEQGPTEGVREVLERVHGRLAVDLERVVEGSSGEGPCTSRGLAELLLSPEVFTGRSPCSWGPFQGQQSAARSASEERVTLRIEARSLLSAELSFDAYVVAPLCAALLGNGLRRTAEECIARVVMAVISEELNRAAAPALSLAR